MKLRELLQQIEDTGIDQEELLDMDIKIKIPESCGNYKIITSPKKVSANRTWDNVSKVRKGIITLDCNFIG